MTKTNSNEQLEALIIAQARERGCTCSPDILMNKIPNDQVATITVAHDWDCPHKAEETAKSA
jgi:hypothetical protein